MYQCKVLVIGNAEVGKTAIVRRITSNSFAVNYKPTVGVDFSLKNVAVTLDGHEYLMRLQLWDVSGQEHANRMVRSYFRNADGCYVVADLSRGNIAAQVKPWLEAIKDAELEVPIMLLLNKVDLQQAQDNLSDEKIIEDIKSLQVDQELCVSALNGKNLQESLDCMSEMLLVRIREKNKDMENDGTAIIAQDEIEKQHSNNKSGKRKCC